MTHVGDEVAPHALDAPSLRHVAGERHRADHLAVASERERTELEHLTRRSVELELALRRDTVERGVQQLVDRVLREHLAVARAVEAARRRVAHDLTTDAVDDDDRVGRLVERGQQPVLDGLSSRDPFGRLSRRVGDRLVERDVLTRVAHFTRPPQLTARSHDAKAQGNCDRPAHEPEHHQQRGHRRPPPSCARAGATTHPNRPVM